VKKWHQLAEEKSKVEQQIQDIRQKFRMDKINKEFGHLSAEEFFKSITKRLDEKSSATAEEDEEQEVPDYTMDEFDRTNPFDYEFRPDAPSPEPSPSPTPPPPPPTPTPPPSYHEVVDGDDLPLQPPPHDRTHRGRTVSTSYIFLDKLSKIPNIPKPIPTELLLL